MSGENKREQWEKNRRIWYNIYLFLGVGVNFLIYFTKPWGFDPGKIIWLGALVGLGIPLAVMFIGVYIHEKIIGL